MNRRSNRQRKEVNVATEAVAGREGAWQQQQQQGVCIRQMRLNMLPQKAEHNKIAHKSGPQVA